MCVALCVTEPDSQSSGTALGVSRSTEVCVTVKKGAGKTPLNVHASNDDAFAGRSSQLLGSCVLHVHSHSPSLSFPVISHPVGRVANIKTKTKNQLIIVL